VRRVAGWTASRLPKISVANPNDELEALVDADLDALATALNVWID